MATIYIIAGPPNIGKSTFGPDFVPEGIKILDPDLIVQRYRELGIRSGYKRFEKMLQHELSANRDFAIELNLGLRKHFDMLRMVKAFHSDNRIEILFFYTDHIDICLARAQARKDNQAHRSMETIEDLYIRALPLLKRNLDIFDTLKGVDVRENSIEPEIIFHYQQSSATIEVSKELPRWAG
ncbi:hypothetical protein [Sphingobacterium sp. DR205]|uniref:hypothetical protein n=1 Tax=Sphingobacterium sp. DR205 TaxID=2713573 RepID=UPI0013E4B5B1|nr:hypothetical protein [Sphingobacterium sp. DR205]QIH33794.1 hypothetical protein G6053_13285 [Sphingobacterium sp. DR205]